MTARAETDAPQAARGNREKMPGSDDNLDELINEAARIVEERMPPGSNLDMSGLQELSDRGIYAFASILAGQHGSLTQPAIAVFALERLHAQDFESAMLWLRVWRALDVFLQTEPDPGRMSH